MTTIPRRVLAAALTSTALSAGAAPSLALATTSSPTARTALATVIAHLRPVIHERINPLNASGSLTFRPGAVNLRRYAAQMADVPADAAQRTAKQDWVSGVRLEARGNLGIAAGLQAKLKHDLPLYRTDVVKGRDTLRRANQLVRGAETSVGLHPSSPVHFVYCAQNICPAG